VDPGVTAKSRAVAHLLSWLVPPSIIFVFPSLRTNAPRVDPNSATAITGSPPISSALNLLVAAVDTQAVEHQSHLQGGFSFAVSLCWSEFERFPMVWRPTAFTVTEQSNSATPI